MAIMCYDVGFDWDAIRRDANDGSLYASVGLYDKTESDKATHRFAIHQHDSIMFNIFDITDWNTGQKPAYTDYDINSFAVTFKKATTKGSGSRSPFNKTVEATDLHYYGEMSSGVYSNTYPAWQVTTNRNDPNNIQFKAANHGRFELTVKAMVTIKGERKIFIRDPEMIVRSEG